jgi:hypothetical protein
MFESLFGYNRGKQDRAVLLEWNGDGTVSIHETNAAGGAGRFQGPMNEETLAAYAHLLQKK